MTKAPSPSPFICEHCGAVRGEATCDCGRPCTPARMFLFSDGQEFLTVIAATPESATRFAREHAARYGDEREQVAEAIARLRKLAELLPVAVARLEEELAHHVEWCSNMKPLPEHVVVEDFEPVRFRDEPAPVAYHSSWEDGGYCGTRYEPESVARVRREHVEQRRVIAALLGGVDYDVPRPPRSYNPPKGEPTDGLESLLEWAKLCWAPSDTSGRK